MILGQCSLILLFFSLAFLDQELNQASHRITMGKYSKFFFSETTNLISMKLKLNYPFVVVCQIIVCHWLLLIGSPIRLRPLLHHYYFGENPQIFCEIAGLISMKFVFLGSRRDNCTSQGSDIRPNWASCCTFDRCDFAQESIGSQILKFQISHGQLGY